MSDIFGEVDEEVRREQLKKLWERYGNYAIAAAFVVVLAVAAWRGYDWWGPQGRRGRGGLHVPRLADEGKHEDAAAAFAKVADSGRLPPAGPVAAGAEIGEPRSQGGGRA